MRCRVGELRAQPAHPARDRRRHIRSHGRRGIPPGVSLDASRFGRTVRMRRDDLLVICIRTG